MRSGKSSDGDFREKLASSAFCSSENDTNLPLSKLYTQPSSDTWHISWFKCSFFTLNAAGERFFSFFSCPNVKSWGLKCQHEMFLLIWSVSPHHVVPLGWGISSEKRKPLPHYAANFRHQEKMFGKFWPRFQVLWSGTLHSLLPWVEQGWFWNLSELKETIYNIYSGTSKVSYRSQASNMNDSIWNSNFVFTVIRGIFFH